MHRGHLAAISDLPVSLSLPFPHVCGASDVTCHFEIQKRRVGGMLSPWKEGFGITRMYPSHHAM
jgi:hypothetical protein